MQTCLPYRLANDKQQHWNLILTTAVSIKGLAMTFSLVVMIMMVLAIITTLPIWPYSRGWGYHNSAALSLITAVVVINAALDRFVF